MRHPFRVLAGQRRAIGGGATVGAVAGGLGRFGSIENTTFSGRGRRDGLLGWHQTPVVFTA